MEMFLNELKQKEQLDLIEKTPDELRKNAGEKKEKGLKLDEQEITQENKDAKLRLEQMHEEHEDQENLHPHWGSSKH